MQCGIQSSKRHNVTNHYMTLGLTPSASQDDIKRAYFELCKLYHPDKNAGSPDSSKKFRDITEAYEILGNEKSRSVYDRKMCYGRHHMDKSRVRSAEGQAYQNEKDFESSKAAMRNRNHFMGKMWYYNFDAWYEAHYGSQFKHKEYEPKDDCGRSWRYEKEEENERDQIRKQGMYLGMSLIGIVILLQFLNILIGHHHTNTQYKQRPLRNLKPKGDVE